MRAAVAADRRATRVGQVSVGARMGRRLDPSRRRLRDRVSRRMARGERRLIVARSLRGAACVDGCPLPSGRVTMARSGGAVDDEAQEHQQNPSRKRSGMHVVLHLGPAPPVSSPPAPGPPGPSRASVAVMTVGSQAGIRLNCSVLSSLYSCFGLVDTSPLRNTGSRLAAVGSVASRWMRRPVLVLETSAGQAQVVFNTPRRIRIARPRWNRATRIEFRASRHAVLVGQRDGVMT
jgi:hypothetical protein